MRNLLRTLRINRLFYQSCNSGKYSSRVFFLIFTMTALNAGAQSTWYVNDNSTAGDVFTSAAGNDLNTGSAAAPFLTISHAMSSAASGDIIYVDAGTYNQNLVVNKTLQLRGANFGASGCGARGAESNINSTSTAFTMASFNSSIDGFKITGVTGISSIGFSGYSISNNIINASANGIICNSISGGGASVGNNCITLSSQFAGSVQTSGIVVSQVTGSTGFSALNNNVTNAFYGYVFYNVNTTATTNIMGGIITGVMQGVLVSNNDPNSLSTSAVTNNLALSGITMSGFSGSYPSISAIDFHAGVYFYGGSSNAAHTVDFSMSNLDVSGTGKTSPSSGGIYIANFGVAQVTCTAFDCNISNNRNRGVQSRGIANVTVNASTLTNNGYDPYGTGGNHGFGAIALNSGILNLTNNFITNPALVTIPYNVYALAIGNAPGGTINATTNRISNAGNANGYLISNHNGTIKGACNWWNSGAECSIIPLIVGGGTNIYSPYLLTDTDGNVAAGYQPTGICGTNVFSGSTSQTDVLCNGLSTGSASVSLSGGTSPYSYSWSNGTLSAATNGLSAGTYSVTATDFNGCTLAYSVTITEPATAVTLSVSSTPVSCYGSSDGTITTLSGGGTGVLSYSWSNGAATPNLAGLTAGDYTVTVTDANGCSVMESDQVGTPDLLTADASGTNASCNSDANGTVSVITAGGNGGNTFLWTPGGSTSTNVSGLTAGVYSVLVTDSKGCSASDSYTVTEPDVLVVNATAADPVLSCNNGVTTSIATQVTGGSTPYTYIWSTSSTDASISGVAAGTYYVTVSDAQGCTDDDDDGVTISNPVHTGSDWYVNDGSGAGDVYTSAVGNNANIGTASCPLADINQAISLSVAGDNIYVDAGSYSGDVLLNKGVHLFGANALVAGNGSRSAESQILNSRVIVSGGGAASFKGFNVYQSGVTTGGIISLSGSTPVVISNNRIERWASVTGTNVRAIEVSATTASTVIEYNLFTGDASGGLFSGHKTWNNGIYANGGSSLSIQNNEFVNCRTAINSDDHSSGVLINNNIFGANGTDLAFGGVSPTTGSYSISGNSFVTGSGTLFNLSNVTTSFRLDAINNTYDGVSGAGLSLEQAMLVEGSTYHKGRVSGVTPRNGLVRWTPGKLYDATTTTIANNILYADAGDIIYVAAGTYNESVTVNKSLTLYGANAGVSCGSRGLESIINSTTASVPVTITSDGVSIDGFEITGSLAPNGISCGSAGRSNLSVRFNNIHNISTGATGATSYAFLVQMGSSNASNVTVSDNCMYDINNGSVNSRGGGIGIVQSTATGELSNVNLERNHIYNVLTARAATGIILNVGASGFTTSTGNVKDARILNNVIHNLSGLWTSAIGLEGNTQGAWVKNNSIHTLSSSKGSPAVARSSGGYDVQGIKLESNRWASGIVVEDNSIATNTFTNSFYGGAVGYAVANYVTTTDGGIFTLGCNWLGSASYNVLEDNATLTGYIFSKDFCSTSFAPWIVNATDNDVITMGFQPVPGSCTGGPVTASLSQTNVSCNGTATGSITLTVNTGTAPFTYLWSNGATTQNISSLTAGSYTVTVTDVNSSSITLTATVTQPGVLTVVSAQSFVTCNGGSNGSVDITVSGGTTPYSYAWSNLSVSEDISALSAGDYSVVVTDANSCTADYHAVIGQADAISINTAQTDVDCYGNATGSATVTVSGGAVNTLTPVGMDGVIGSEWAGATVKVVNYNPSAPQGNFGSPTGENHVVAYEVYTRQDAKFAYVGIKTNSALGGAANAAVRFANIYFGGSASVGFETGTGTTNAFRPGVPGSYSVASLVATPYEVFTATDFSSSEYTIELAVPFQFLEDDPLGVGFTPKFDGTSGRSLLRVNLSQSFGYSVAGGQTTYGTTRLGNYSIPSNILDAGYTYLWSTGGSTGGINSVVAGTYTLTVTDDNGCSSSTSVTITEPPLLTASAVAADPILSCNNGVTTTADANAAGGTTPYSYLWSNGQSSAIATGLSAGTYTVTVTDAHNCTIVSMVTVSNPVHTGSDWYVNDGSGAGDVYTSAVGNNANIGTASCPLADINQAISLSVAGDNIYVDAGSYSGDVLLNKGVHLLGANALVAGNGSRSAESQILNSRVLVSGGGAASFKGFNVYQSGVTTGGIISLSGSTPVVISNNRIERWASVTGTNVRAIEVSATTASTVIEYNLFTGDASGGLFSGHKSWNNGIYANGGSSLSIQNNEFVNCRTAINSDDHSSGVLINNNIFGANGTDLAFGGVSPTTGSYSISGNSFVTGSGTLFNLSNVATSFRLDAINNTYDGVSGAGLSLNQAMVVEGSTYHKGRVSGTPRNGLVRWTPGKLYDATTTTIANNISYADAGDIIYVAAGTYNESVTVNKSLTLYGANAGVSCGSRGLESIINSTTASVPVTITSDGVSIDGFEITGSLAPNGISCGSAGRSNLSVRYNNIHNISTGATGATSYAFLVQMGSSNASNVTVSDNCMYDINNGSANSRGGGIGIVQSTATGELSNVNLERNHIYNVLTARAATGIILNVGASGFTTSTGNVKDARILNNVIHNLSGLWTSAIGLEGNTQGAWIKNNSIHTLSSSKGSPAVARSSGGYDVQGIKLESNRYASTIVVEDNSIAANTFTNSFYGGAVGYAVANYVTTTDGGALTLGCNWLGSASYNVLQDNAGLTGYIFNKDFCSTSFAPWIVSATDNDVITMGFQPVPGSCTGATISIAAIATDVSCNGGSNGSVDATVTGGTSPLTYLWSNGATTQDIGSVIAGTYTVTVSDVNGSTASATAVVNEPAVLTITASATPVSCNGGSDGTLSTIVAGGNGGYQYLWSNASTSFTQSGLIAGTYTVTVTDSKGCTAVSSATVIEPDVLTASASVTSDYYGADISCNGSFDGSVTVGVAGGNGGYMYLWSNGNTSSSPNGLSAGTYTVTITDTKGCFVTTSVTLTQPASLVATSEQSGAVITCYAATTQVTISATGGTGSYTGTGTFTIGAGSHDYTVTDANGCSSVTNIVVTEPPILPMPVISGTFNRCAAGAGTATFSVAPVSDGVNTTSYVWSVPTGFTITSGQNTTTINVSYTAAAIDATISGQLSCSAFSVCTTRTANAAIIYSSVLPVMPNSISGPTRLCSGDNAIYSIATVYRATSYLWTVPAGVTITSGLNTNIITVSVNGAYTGGNFTVAAVNACGTGAARTRVTSLNILPTPGSITGQATGLCGASGIVYSIAAVPGASTYTWSVPAGASITSGNGTTSITVSFTSFTTSGLVTVTATNACGTSSARSLSLGAAPGRPGLIAGTTASCPNASDLYSIGTVTGAVTYTWSVTSGGSVTAGQGTKNATITWSPIASGTQTVIVVATNACGVSTNRTLAVLMGSCSREGIAEGVTITAYPNPATTIAFVEFSGQANQQFNLKLNDLSGRTMLFESGVTATGLNKIQLDLANVPSGVYLVVLETSDAREVLRLMVE